ncbi:MULTISPECIES: hypothetical protein [unclassified Sinorhizobium]|uniref:hypothetical protein n=1 Tax=unclassified Sinorhizobium TaxID=2613772 RepID=UPI003524C9B9
MMDAGVEASPGPNVAAIESIEGEAWLDMYAAAPGAYVRQSGLKFERLGTLIALADQSIPSTEFNRALCLGHSNPATEAELDRAIAWLKNNASPSWAIQIPPPVQPDVIGHWMETRGLAKSGNGWAKHHRGANAVRQTSRASSFEVRLADEHDAQEFGHIAHAGFGLPQSTVPWFASLIGRPKWKIFLAYDGDDPIAGGALFLDGDWGWLGIDTTLPGYRGRGAQSALIARRLEAGVAAGATGFTAETGQPPAGEEGKYASYRNYRSAGFEVAYVRPNYKIA